MNHLLRRLCTAATVGFCLTAAQAQEVRLGFVSTDRVLKEASTAKAAQTKLEQEFSKREKDLVDQGASIKSMADKFEREAPTLPETQRQAKQKLLLEQDRDFQRKRREFQEDLNSRKNEELQLVIQRANKAIKEIAVAEKYDFIFQDAVYVNPKHDITDKVIKTLNSVAK
ncbi:OmpH family outer membrane protein [Rhodoferax sp.]|uniref:OmpH family outer membrane protein n=1 Tax=Rhodoferax sp. TaxID=50421 RepID=UPI00262F3834|nr:OmpH family outer membrane protein [Rhodoferax sp.]MDD2808934.1 OmpH family outer membrane protein [Rhodoferax sp.]MDD5478841.1 OmpH family outer membrane protein [Rhodoferax sp.]